MTISREQVYELIKQLSENECYVGLHGIADKSDLINEFSHLSKNEKAKKILEVGLKNARGQTISHTVRNFGLLENMTIMDIKNINDYGFYSPSGEEAIVVISIPLFFEDSNGMKIFGGYKESKSSDIDSAECITDYIFKDNIPTEMILGFYTYNRNGNNVEFIENPKYYSKLSQSEKDEFINRYFNKYNAFDVNNDELIERVKEFANDWEHLSYLKKTIEQYEHRLEKQKNNSSKETHSLDYAKELCQRMDKVLNGCQHISDIREDVLDFIRNAAKNESNYLEWLYYQKHDLLKEHREFKNLSYILDDPQLPFYSQLVTNEFSYGGNDNVFNSMIALPIYTMPQISGNLDENFRLKYFQKMQLGNNSCIVIEKSIANSELEIIKQAILEKIHNKELQIDRKLTEEEKNGIISSVTSLYGMENITSFDFNNGLLVPDWQKYSKENNIPDLNSNGLSTWQLTSMQIIDNRAKINGQIDTLEGQLEMQRFNDTDITKINHNKEEIKPEDALLNAIDENYEYRNILSKVGSDRLLGPNDEPLLDLNELRNMVANGKISEVGSLLYNENKYLRDMIKNSNKKDDEEIELLNQGNEENKTEEKGYSVIQLDSTKLSDLNMSLVKPNYDIIFHSQTSNDLGITEILLHRIGQELGLNVQMDKDAYNSFVEELKKQGKTIEQIDELCKKYYKEHKKEIDDMFLRELELNSFSATMNDNYTK